MNVKRNPLKFLLSNFMLIGSIGFSINAQAATCWCKYEIQGFFASEFVADVKNTSSACKKQCDEIYNDFLSTKNEGYGELIKTGIIVNIFENKNLKYNLYSKYDGSTKQLDFSVEDMLCQNFLKVEAVITSKLQGNSKKESFSRRDHNICRGMKQ